MNDGEFRYAALDFIRAGFCPLAFDAMRLAEHPQYRSLPCPDAALGKLEVGESLIQVGQFPYVDSNKHRKTGTQIVTAPFGLSPVDFDLLLGLFDYLKRNPEQIDNERKVRLSAYFLGKLAGLPTTSTDNINRIRSRVFRLSYVKYTNSVAWNSRRRQYYDLSNFEFFSLNSMSRLTESCRPIVMQLSDEFVRLTREAPCLAYSQQLYRSLSPGLRRIYLLANRDGWHAAHSTMFDADQFCIHQLGYTVASDPAVDRTRRRDRRHKLKRLLRQAEDVGLIRPYKPWNGYFGMPTSGPLKGKQALRWSRGPALKTKDNAKATSNSSLANDALFEQVRQLRDQDGQPILPAVYRRLLVEHGRPKLQKHCEIVLAQREVRPGSFEKSEIATYVNRVQNDYAPPDWFQDLARTKDLAGFDQLTPTAASESLYQAIIR